ncbi:MAG: BCD family MFS transporter [Hyphomicrobiaceae bacterium]|nr:BCD family MFS transporter [Hyphomicrobiaceae bacterium]
MNERTFGWIGIVRLGLVQVALGSIVAITNSTLNRVMVVELALLATLPGALVALHYAVQALRPRWGYGSDVGGRRTPWIIGGMAILAAGGVGAAAATAAMTASVWIGLAGSVIAYVLIGIGVGACGTNLLALLATRVAPERRPAAAAVVWLMMIAGIVVTSKTVGAVLDPFSFGRLVAVTASVCAIALLLTILAIWQLEGGATTAAPKRESVADAPPFSQALAQVWSETESRRFALFVFVAMLAYNAQDLILEPFAGLVFGLTPGETTSLSGVQHQGVFMGMLAAGSIGSYFAGSRIGSMRGWTIWGCAASAVALIGLSLVGLSGAGPLLKPAVFALGAANGAFAVAAIGSMMTLAGTGQKSREGTRMGLWGAAQAMAFGLGGLAGTLGVDIARLAFEDPAKSYGIVFAAEGLLFLVAAMLAARLVSRTTLQKQSSRGLSPA